MRPLLHGTLLLVTAVAAPPVTHTDIVVKLVSDLLPLKLAVASDEPLKDVYTPAELQSLETYSQSQAMKPFEKDLAEFRHQQYLANHKPVNDRISFRPFIGLDQAYKLAYVLMGKDLSEPNVKPLVQALLSMFESAEVCRDERCALGDSLEFRTAAENARNALHVLGVSSHDVRIVMDSLFRAAIAAGSPPPSINYQ